MQRDDSDVGSSSASRRTRDYNTMPLPTLRQTEDFSAQSSSTGRHDGELRARYHTAPLPQLPSLTEDYEYIRERGEDLLPAALSSWTSLMSGELPSLRSRQPTPDDLPTIDPLTPPEGPPIIGKQNPMQASFSLIKAVVGAGSFALPAAFMEAGLWGGVVGILVLAALSLFTILLLIRCKNELPALKGRYVSYVDVVQETFGRPLAVVVYIAIVITSLGACAAYLVFCGGLLETVVRGKIEAKYFVLMMGAPLVVFCWIRSFRYLSFTSVLGDIALLLGMSAVFIEGFRTTSVDSPLDYPAFKVQSYPLFFGSAAFLFCIHMLVIPVEQSMKNPKRFPTAAVGSFGVVTVLNLVFGAIGYMLFKSKTQGVVIDNLGENAFVDVARVALVFDLFFTYIVVLVPARDIIEASLLKEGTASASNKRTKDGSTYSKLINEGDEEDRDGRPIGHYLSPESRWSRIKRLWIMKQVWSKDMARNAIRAVLVGVTVVVATVINQFNDIIGLVSGLSLSLTAFILPGMIHLKMHYRKPDGRFNFGVMIFVDLFLIVFGLVAAISTSTETIINLAKHGIKF